MELYRQLEEFEPNTSVSDVDEVRIANRIETLDKEHQTWFFALILHHYLQNNKNVSALKERSMPYKGYTISTGKGVKYFLNKFPDDLKIILIKFILYLEESNSNDE